MLRFLLAGVLVVLSVTEVEAYPWRRRARNNNYTYSTYRYNNYNYSYSNTGYTNTGYTNYTTTNTGYTGGPQAVAATKASRSAQMGLKGQHLGGGFGGAYAEGVGFSPYSAQAALNSCCFTGQRTVAGSAVVRGADGWYAVKMYW